MVPIKKITENPQLGEVKQIFFLNQKTGFIKVGG